MSSTTVSPTAPSTEEWADPRLVRECLNGNEEAWTALIDKYKRLIYSIPIKYGLPPEDAADIFQAVCLEALSKLETLREPRALPKWLIQITVHKTYRFRHLQSRSVPLDEENEQLPKSGAPPPGVEEVLDEAEREQSLREAIAALPPRCSQLVRLLFYEDPPIPYAEVAKQLGIAIGSIGFIRGRCLKRLRCQLEPPNQ